MSLTQFKAQFADRWQDIFNKTLVGKKVATFRLQSNLTQGESVARFILDLSQVRVRTITPHVDRTIDPVTNSKELLQITEYKGASFPISQWEKTLQGDPELGTKIGREVAIKVQTYLDADILTEVRNASNTFDTGDLSGIASNGTPIVLTTANVPKFVTRPKAKLGSNQVRGKKMAWVIDDYALATINEHQLGRDTDMGDNTYKNGMSGTIVKSDVYVSDNLTGEAVLSMATQVTADDTVVVGGVTFTFKASPASAGHVDIGANVDETRANLAAAINGGAGAGSDYIEVSSADRATLDGLRITATNDDTANTLTLVGIGSGRLVLSETLTNGSDEFTKNFIHAFYGVVGAIDVVVQKEVNMFMTQEPKQDTKNIFNDLIYGVKTFADGARKMLDVHLDANS